MVWNQGGERDCQVQGPKERVVNLRRFPILNMALIGALGFGRTLDDGRLYRRMSVRDDMTT